MKMLVVCLPYKDFALNDNTIGFWEVYLLAIYWIFEESQMLDFADTWPAFHVDIEFQHC